MDEQTRKLLEECTSGCRMAEDSIGQVREYIRDHRLLELADSYAQRHAKLRQEADGMNVSANAVMSRRSRELSPALLHGLPQR